MNIEHAALHGLVMMVVVVQYRQPFLEKLHIMDMHEYRLFLLQEVIRRTSRDHRLTSSRTRIELQATHIKH